MTTCLNTLRRERQSRASRHRARVRELGERKGIDTALPERQTLLEQVKSAASSNREGA